MLSVSTSSLNFGEADLKSFGSSNELQPVDKTFSDVEITVNSEASGNVEETISKKMEYQQEPPLICEQGPSTPSSPTVSPTSHLSRPQIPNLIISDSIDRMNLLTPDYGTAFDCNKLSPFRTYSTSDLGSSAQSSFSTTPNSLGNAWSGFRDYRRSNPESDTDSDVFSKDLLSPSMTYSPSPFSPFSDCSEPPDTPQSLSAFLGNSPSVSPHLPLNCLHFSFDDTTSVDDEMDWSETAKLPKESHPPSHRIPNFAIETVLSYPDQLSEAERLKDVQENGADSSLLQVGEGFTEETLLQAETDTARDKYVEKQLAEWKNRFKTQSQLQKDNYAKSPLEGVESQRDVFRFHDWNGLERVGGPLMASSFWLKSRSTPNIATKMFQSPQCSENRENQSESQTQLTTLQHSDVAEKSISIRQCLLCREAFEDDEALKLHAIRRHSQSTDDQTLSLQCQLCHLSFVSQNSFEEHIASNHQVSKMYFLPASDGLCFQYNQIPEKESDNVTEKSVQQVAGPTDMRNLTAEQLKVMNGSAGIAQTSKTVPCNEIVKKERLKQHIIIKNEEHYPCPQCPQIFEGKEGLRDHLLTNHMTSEERQKYHQQELLKQQEANMGCKKGKNLYKCSVCKQGFPNQERCFVHIAMEHPMQPLHAEGPQECDCTKCKQSQQTTNIQDVSKNQRSFKHIKDEIVCDGFRCSECGKLFPSRNHVEEHEAVVHQGPSTSNVPFGKFVCQFCNEGFSNQDRLTKHIASRHRNPIEEAQKAHKCSVCGKGFARTDMLSRHMRLHKGDKPFSCTVCGQEFSRSDHLTTHMRTHSGEKPYRCPFCCYAASRRDMMNRHLKTHSKSPEHIKAQEARLSTDNRSSSTSPNPAATPIAAKPVRRNTSPGPITNTFLNSTFLPTQMTSQNPFPVLRPISPLPTYGNLPLRTTPLLSRSSFSHSEIVLPSPDTFISREAFLSKQQLEVQQALVATPQLNLSTQQTEFSVSPIGLVANPQIANPGKVEPLSNLQYISAANANPSNYNLLAPPLLFKALSLPSSPRLQKQSSFDAFSTNQ